MRGIGTTGPPRDGFNIELEHVQAILLMRCDLRIRLGGLWIYDILDLANILRLPLNLLVLDPFDAAESMNLLLLRFLERCQLAEGTHFLFNHWLLFDYMGRRIMLKWRVPFVLRMMIDLNRGSITRRRKSMIIIECSSRIIHLSLVFFLQSGCLRRAFRVVAIGRLSFTVWGGERGRWRFGHFMLFLDAACCRVIEYFPIISFLRLLSVHIDVVFRYVLAIVQAK